MIPGFIFFASMAIPFAVFIMFYELNVRRDVSMYNAIRGLLGGGAASLLYTLLIHSKLTFLNLEGAWWAGPIEECAKLYAALFVARYITLRNGRILTGFCLGAQRVPALQFLRQPGTFSDIWLWISSTARLRVWT